MHNAVSLDGRITGFSVDTGLYYELASTWNADAMLSGSATALAASSGQLPDPESNPGQFLADHPHYKGDSLPGIPRYSADPRPLLAVVDSRGRVNTWRQWQKAPFWRGIVVLCSSTTPRSYLHYLSLCSIDTIVAGTDRVDLSRALLELNLRYGVRTVRTDSGGTLNGALLSAGLVDEVSLLVHPELAGGPPGPTIFHPDPSSPCTPVPLTRMHTEELRNGIVWLRYKVKRNPVTNTGYTAPE